MKENTRISNLHCKFAEKSWNDTFQLVRRCMEISRDESKPCEPLVRSLERLQEEFQAPYMNNIKSRLEIIARQQGMGFHFADATCYLTADLFYLEVLLLPSGEVQEVKVATHGEHPVPSVSLLHLLGSNNFDDFSIRLGELFAQYNIPGDNETKSKLLTSLKYLWKDLQQISEMPNDSEGCETQMDVINSGRVGLLMAGKQDYPQSLYFYTHPNDGPKNSDLSFEELLEFKPAVQAAQVTMGVSDLSHKLQMTSLISQPPQLDDQRCPVFFPLGDVINEMLPACFLLRLKPPIPLLSSFIERVGQITDVPVPDLDLQWAPLPKLLLKGSASANGQSGPLEEQEIFRVVLPEGEIHTYILPEAAWDVPTQRAALLDGVPFTHPAHVCAILELLRHQCAYNTLLNSCFTPLSTCPGSVCDLYFEVRPESTTSISVTFHHTDSLAVLLVNISNPRQITCKLFGAGLSDPALDEYTSTVLMSCMSIPATMRTLYSRLEEITTAPLSTSHSAATEAENDHLSPVMDTDGQLPAVSQSEAMPEDNSVPGSACSTVSVATSELEINGSMLVNPYPFVPVHVMANCQS
ncbi:PREDICTED: mediator of RNA polymerase II transcription subunit 1-like isoform X1 [Cyprinodon variegatus]|uniref:mediator of RNA polymerase II transcription subunit 1-like isoform X1 n=1 Tax=Cyprinodon variegatus TaxID=28743 RepID=UPI000742ADEB|nr:PREDICTED: mediator of RNA polymerase II transcription subunit 1-like isoform X1 [Cyprinodon variegatus]XP_015252993.1 PREDICTED: mediator of RNA polymerase II transcription subunit 1-like isoform X1 [Cyprinodon variegatus]XP_015252994.1 PREDICTED: mediator of RNA polymerase II transcription subunit 1-like isoform X1 [Cyprinodon variegatus]XP_015252995.1 PREDICTED: mediator of RNA polymerase II transcription subunit 1-like isoform X1 [Cyprinodon variegatus]